MTETGRLWCENIDLELPSIYMAELLSNLDPSEDEDLISPFATCLQVAPCSYFVSFRKPFCKSNLPKIIELSMKRDVALKDVVSFPTESS